MQFNLSTEFVSAPRLSILTLSQWDLLSRKSISIPQENAKKFMAGELFVATDPLIDVCRYFKFFQKQVGEVP